MSDAKIISGQLAVDCYPASFQAGLNEWASKSSAQWPNVVGIVKSVAEPAVTDRDKLWIKIDGSGNELGYFIYGNGRWHWRHPLIPGFTTIAPASITSATDLDTYDGGVAGVVGSDSGPMWEIDTAFAGRSPMGPGAIPTSNPAKTLAVNEQFGEGAHMMTSQEVGPHTHEPSPKTMAETPGSGSVQGILFGGTGNARPDLAVLANTYTTAGQQSAPVVHPVIGRFFIRRTARLNYVP